MFEFLVETYAESEATNLVAARVDAAALAAEQVREAGAEVRLLHVILVPGDETCFYLYQSPSADAVRQALIRARLQVERISEAISIKPAQARTRTPPPPKKAHRQAPT
jgi:hypothetical protein